jgi:putative inorganic carbon (hco3(-)) transporter
VLFGHPVLHYVPVHYPALDPLAIIVYVFFFVIVTLVTMRRAAFGLCVLIASQPFAFYHDVLSTTVTMPKVALLGVLFGLLCYPNAFASLGSKAPWRILIAGLFVFAATLVSFLHAAHHGPVLRESLKILEYVVLFSAVVAAYRLDPDTRLIRSAVMVTAIAVALLALAQELVGAPSGLWINGHQVPRIAGPLEGPNQLAGYFDVALPLTLAIAMTEPSALAIATLALIACADFLTFSRGGLIAAVISVGVVGFLVRKNLRQALVPLAFGVLAGAIVDACWAFQFHLGRVGGLFAAFRLQDNESSYGGGVGTRSELWHAAIALWKQHKLFGIGAGNFELEIPLTGLKGVRTHANSLYLQSLVEGGIPLIAATLYLTYTSIAVFVRKHMESPFVAGAFAASIALAIHQIIDFLTFYPKVGGEWWIALGLGAAELAIAVRVGAAACA